MQIGTTIINQEGIFDVANRLSALEHLKISSVDDTWIKIRDSIKASAEEKLGILKHIQINRNSGDRDLMPALKVVTNTILDFTIKKSNLDRDFAEKK